MIPKIINRSELARQLGIRKQSLNNKIKEVQRNRITESDKLKIVEILNKAIDDIFRIE